jgi:beta-lactam-binding protein with PASTA domain
MSKKPKKTDVTKTATRASGKPAVDPATNSAVDSGAKEAVRSAVVSATNVPVKSSADSTAKNADTKPAASGKKQQPKTGIKKSTETVKKLAEKVKKPKGTGKKPQASGESPVKGGQLATSGQSVAGSKNMTQADAPSTELALADSTPSSVIADRLTQIAQREAIIEKHLAHLRAEVMSDADLDEDVSEGDWLDTTGKDEQELRDESLARFDTLEGDSGIDTSRIKKKLEPYLIGFLVVTIIALAIVYFGFFHGGVIRVPDLVGLTSSQAAATLRENGLSVGNIIEEANPSVALGIVLNQDPKVDRIVPRGSTVTIVVSAESSKVVVPQVEGLTADEARIILNQARLTMQEVATYDAIALVGEIVGQLPVSETVVESGSTVCVLVSQGVTGTLVPTPRIIGLNAADAERILLNAGFTPLPYTASTTFGKIGEVVAQTPATGMMTYPGSPVQYLISETIAGAESNVPDTVGMREENAKLIIEESGFRAVFYPYFDSQITTGTIVAQMPIPQDTLLRRGDTIELLVARGNDIRAVVPDVLDRSVTEARSELREMGFMPIVVPLPPTARESKVYQQFPARDSDYFVGLPVLLYAGESRK